MMKITVKSKNKTEIINADSFDNLLSALRYYGYSIDASCDGSGTCGKCKVISNNEIVLSCKTKPQNDMFVELIDNNGFSQFTKKDLKGFTEALIDIGTTTVCISLIQNKKIIATCVEKNKQQSFGSDIMSRISHGERHDLDLMNKTIIFQINSMLKKFEMPIEKITVCGNTAMLHIFLNEPCKAMGIYPYTPKFINEKYFENAEKIGLDFNVPIYILPCISAFCGADILSGISVIYDEKSSVKLLMDFGTNCEIALIKNSEILVTSTASGPAFEGGKISCGMPGIDGAISHFKLVDNVPNIETIGGKTPIGICGSGLIDIIAELYKNNIIAANGYLEKPYKIYGNIYITNEDVKEFLLAKSAVQTALEILTENIRIDKMFLSGSFGSAVNISNAQFLKIIPNCEAIPIGNSAVKGMLNGNENLWNSISKKARDVEINKHKNFEKLFINNLCLNCILSQGNLI